MTDALKDYKGTVSIGARTITNLCVADNIDGLAGEIEEVAKLVEHLQKVPTAYSMEISAEKTKLMTNKATCAVLFNSSIGDWFQTTVGVR